MTNERAEKVEETLRCATHGGPTARAVLPHEVRPHQELAAWPPPAHVKEQLTNQATNLREPVPDRATAVSPGANVAEPPDESLIGHFKIIKRIGEGGMGEVYLAEDVTLPRQVAIKILPPHFTADADRVQRFMREARLVSRLNHPNIITIHEVKLDRSRPYIVTEFIEGVTLRQRMNDGPMSLPEVVDVTTQIVSALKAAHQAEIVHRDVKPENIMLRHDGYVKVLDFGLAKLLAVQADSETPTKEFINSEAGLIMGTVRYMSPEQARGLPTDARTDVWSLGVMLYEMITGRAPFEGSTSSDVMASILRTEPPSLLCFRPGTPAALQQFVHKALRKDYAERYQTAGDMAIDLKWLRLEVDAVDEPVPQSEQWFGEQQTIVGPTVITAMVAAANTAEGSGLGFNARGERHLGRAYPRRGKLLFALLAAFILIALGLASWLFAPAWQRRAKSPAFALEKMRLNKVTTSGKAVMAAISPDGRYVAYALNDLGQQSLQVRQVATTSSIQVVSPEKARYVGLTFSPDGNYIYYVRFEDEHPLGALYRVPVLGGVPRLLLARIDSRITFSPDGQRFAFVRNDPGAAVSALIVAGTESLDEQKVAVRKSPDNFATPAWSPDGKSIVCSARFFSNGNYREVLEVSLTNGAVRSLSTRRWESVGSISWLGDSSGVIIAARDDASGNTHRQQIWHLSYPAGEVRRLINDLSNYNSVHLAADSQSLVCVQLDEYSNIWIVDLAKGASATARQVTANRYDGIGLVWTPDQKIVYRSLASGNPDIWMVDADGTNERQLTTDPRPDFQPVVTPDGRHIIFTSQRATTTNIWRMNADGSNQTQLTSGAVDNEPSCSPDGEWVVYTSWSGERPTLWKVPVAGGSPIRITDYYTSAPVVSPDGQSIACSYRSKERGLEWSTAIVPFKGGQPSKVFKWHSPAVRWAMNGQALLYVNTRDGVANVFKQPVAAGPVAQVTNFKSEKIFFFDLSRRDQQLAMARGAQIGDVIQMSNFR